MTYLELVVWSSLSGYDIAAYFMYMFLAGRWCHYMAREPFKRCNTGKSVFLASWSVLSVPFLQGETMYTPHPTTLVWITWWSGDQEVTSADQSFTQVLQLHREGDDEEAQIASNQAEYYANLARKISVFIFFMLFLLFVAALLMGICFAIDSRLH